MEAVINSDDFYKDLYSKCARCAQDIRDPDLSIYKGICDDCIILILDSDE